MDSGQSLARAASANPLTPRASAACGRPSRQSHSGRGSGTPQGAPDGSTQERQPGPRAGAGNFWGCAPSRRICYTELGGFQPSWPQRTDIPPAQRSARFCSPENIAVLGKQFLSTWPVCVSLSPLSAFSSLTWNAVKSLNSCCQSWWFLSRRQNLCEVRSCTPQAQSPFLPTSFTQK